MRDDMVTLHSPVTAEQLAHRPWREVIGPIHPEDEFWAAVAKAAK